MTVIYLYCHILNAQSFTIANYFINTALQQIPKHGNVQEAQRFIYR